MAKNTQSEFKVVGLSQLKQEDIFRFEGKKQVYVYNGKTRGRNSKFAYYKWDDVNAHYETASGSRRVEINFEF